MKRAYLRLNGEGLKERYDEVQVKIREVLTRLQAAPCALADAWEPPPTPDASVSADDPNTLCVPQAEDYVLPGYHGDTDVGDGLDG